jgi:Ca2+-binding EF-hand superfamily protein
MNPTEKMRHYVSVNFLCDTDGEEPTQEQLNEAFRAMLKEEQGTIEFEVWDGRWLDERNGD